MSDVVTRRARAKEGKKGGVKQMSQRPLFGGAKLTPGESVWTPGNTKPKK